MTEYLKTTVFGAIISLAIFAIIAPFFYDAAAMLWAIFLSIFVGGWIVGKIALWLLPERFK